VSSASSRTWGRTAWPIFLPVVAMTGCTQPADQPRDFCDIAAPIVLPDEAAAAVATMAPATGAQIVKQNVFGIENCPAVWWAGRSTAGKD